MPSIFYIATALLLLAGFFLLMLFTRTDRNIMYIKYSLLIYPFAAIDFLPKAYSTSLFDFITIIFVILFYQHKKVPIKHLSFYLYVLGLLVVAVIMGIFTAESVSTTTISVIIQYVAISFYAVIVINECLSNDSFVHVILDFLKVPLVLSLIFLGIQLLVGPSFTFERNLNQNVISGLSTRYPGFFQDPQKFAQFLAASSILLIVKPRRQSFYRYLNILLLPLSLVALLFSGGRAGLGGWVLGIFLILLAGGKKYRMAVLAAGCVLFYIASNYADKFPMLDRMTSLNEDYAFRYSIWMDAVGIFRDNPVFGIGMGNYADYVSIHNPDQIWWADNGYSYFDHPESGYLKFLTELGATGFIAVMSFILLPVVQSFRTYLKGGNTNIIIMIAALASWMVGFYTLYSFDDVRIRILIVTILCLLITSFKWGRADAEV